MRKLAILVLTLGLTGAVLTACSDDNDIENNNLTSTEAPATTATVTETPDAPDKEKIDVTATVTEAPVADVTEAPTEATDDTNGGTSAGSDNIASNGQDSSKDGSEEVTSDGNTGEDVPDGGHNVALGVDVDENGNEIITGTPDDGSETVSGDPATDPIISTDGNGEIFGEISYGERTREEKLADFEKNRYIFNGNETPMEIVTIYMDGFVNLDSYKMLSCVYFDSENEDYFLMNIDESDIFDDEIFDMLKLEYSLGEMVEVGEEEFRSFYDELMVAPEKISDVYKVPATIKISFGDFIEEDEETIMMNYVGKIDGEYRIIYSDGEVEL